MPAVFAKHGHIAREIVMRDGREASDPVRTLDYEGVYFEKLSGYGFRNSAEIEVVEDEKRIAAAKARHEAEKKRAEIAASKAAKSAS